MPKSPKIKKSPPLVSVGLMTYQRPKEFIRSFKSIVGQTYQNLEIIVSENYSPGFDEKAALVKKTLKKDKRISYFQHKPNKGIYFNVNFVLKKANGKYFMWAADDDYWDKKHIEIMVQELEANPGAGVALGALKLLNTNKPPEEIRINDKYNPNDKSFYGTLWAALHPAVSKYNYFISGFFQRKLLNDVFFQVADFYTPDIIFIILFSLIAPFRYVDKILLYCGSADSTYRSKEERNEINVFSFRGEIANPFKLTWAIIVSPQIPWIRKFYSLIGFFVLFFRLFILLSIRILELIIVGLYKLSNKFINLISESSNWTIRKITRLRDFLINRYYCSK